MSKYRYTLEPYKGSSSRFRCPECGNGRKFSRYIDVNTGEYVADHVGRCDRENNCGYHLVPGQFFAEGGKAPDEGTPPRRQVQLEERVLPSGAANVPDSLFKGSLKKYEENKFVFYLRNIFGWEITEQLIRRYFIGTSKHWPGATVFWQIEDVGKVRAGKIMLYNSDTGKRVKEPKNYVSWVHVVHPELKNSGYNLRQCLFGEHLLKGNKKPVAIVESEKTAIVASVYFPQYAWLATGGASNLSTNLFKVLQGREVYLFPDLKAYESWRKKADELLLLLPGTKFKASGLLEKHAKAEDRQQGLDLADYLVRFEYKDFIQSKNKTGPQASIGMKAAPQLPVKQAQDQQAQWNKLTNKYPNLNILKERLGLEFVRSLA